MNWTLSRIRLSKCVQISRVRRLSVICLCLVSITPWAAAQDVLTWHNDNARTGQYLDEKILTLQSVNPKTFGKLFVIRVDGKVDAEPLYAGGLKIPQHGTRNVLFVATEHDSVYAVDADTGKEFWHVRLLGLGETTSDDRSCSQVTPEIGITSTPVIDRQHGPHGTMFVVSMSKDSGGNYWQRLHALDLQTGGEEFGGPVEVRATFPGGGATSRDGTEIFDPKQYEERAALLLLNGVVYTSWASHCDIDPYNGWVIGYSAETLKQAAVVNFTPNGEQGSVWQSGAGPAADGQGNLYVMAANGTFDTVLNSQGLPSRGDFGNAFLKISTTNGTLSIADYFCMFDVIAENAADMDLGAGGPVVLPDLRDASGKTHRLVVGAGKDRNIYLLNREALGKFNPQGNQNIYQEVEKALKGIRYRGAPAYFDGRLYFGSVDAQLVEFRFADARLVAEPASRTAAIFPYPGAMPAVSADELRNGIVWVAENGDQAALRAYDAGDLAHELYNSNLASGGRDHLGMGNKFITPMIAHGKVYVGTVDGVGVFGLLRKPASFKNHPPQ